MDTKKKQPHKRCIPQIKQLPSQNIRPNLYGNTGHTRNIRNHRFKCKTTEYQLVQVSGNDKIQMRMVR